MNEEKRIELKEPIPTFDKFTYKCAKCEALLFATDNYCPWCGANVSGLIGVVTLRDVEE